MSEANLLRKPPAPSARVWQATDLLRLDAGEGGFVRTAWSGKTAPAFNVPAVKILETLKAASALAPAEAALPAVTGPGESEVGSLDAENETPAEPDVSAEALKAAQDAAYAEGLADGERRAREAFEADQQSRQGGSQSLLLALDEAVRGLIQTPAQIHEPLKRLALHLAEQLVLAELSVSPQAIERLVRRAVDELAAPRQAPVLVELHPDDLAMLKTGTALADALAADRPWQLQPNAAMLPGSVKVSANDGVLVDLIENRLEALAQGLLLEPTRGLSQSAFTPARMASRQASGQPVVDAQARMAPAWRGASAEPETLEAEQAIDPLKAEIIDDVLMDDVDESDSAEGQTDV